MAVEFSIYEIEFSSSSLGEYEPGTVYLVADSGYIYGANYYRPEMVDEIIRLMQADTKLEQSDLDNPHVVYIKDENNNVKPVTLTKGDRELISSSDCEDYGLAVNCVGAFVRGVGLSFYRNRFTGKPINEITDGLRDRLSEMFNASPETRSREYKPLDHNQLDAAVTDWNLSNYRLFGHPYTAVITSAPADRSQEHQPFVGKLEGVALPSSAEKLRNVWKKYSPQSQKSMVFNYSLHRTSDGEQLAKGTAHPYPDPSATSVEADAKKIDTQLFRELAKSVRVEARLDTPNALDAHRPDICFDVSFDIDSEKFHGTRRWYDYYSMANFFLECVGFASRIDQRTTRLNPSIPDRSGLISHLFELDPQPQAPSRTSKPLLIYDGATAQLTVHPEVLDEASTPRERELGNKFLEELKDKVWNASSEMLPSMDNKYAIILTDDNLPDAEHYTEEFFLRNPEDHNLSAIRFGNNWGELEQQVPGYGYFYKLVHTETEVTISSGHLLTSDIEQDITDFENAQSDLHFEVYEDLCDGRISLVASSPSSDKAGFVMRGYEAHPGQLAYDVERLLKGTIPHKSLLQWNSTAQFTADPDRKLAGEVAERGSRIISLIPSTGQFEIDGDQANMIQKELNQLKFDISGQFSGFPSLRIVDKLAIPLDKSVKAYTALVFDYPDSYLDNQVWHMFNNPEQHMFEGDLLGVHQVDSLEELQQKLPHNASYYALYGKQGRLVETGRISAGFASCTNPVRPRRTREGLSHGVKARQQEAQIDQQAKTTPPAQRKRRHEADL